MAQKSNYHHGDLRATLIAIGSEMLVQDGVQALSLRKLARRAGVSHNAPYMHFADKEALLAAIAEDGFERLSAELETAIAAAGENWQARFHAGIQAYLRFALHHEGHVRVMFRPWDAKAYPTTTAAGAAAFAILLDLIENGQARGELKASSPREMAATVWSLLHGFSLLTIGRKMPPTIMGDATPDEMLARFIGMLLDGLAAGANGTC